MSFGHIRLAAALIVLFSHCYSLTENKDPLLQLVHIPMRDVAVYVFFFLSGYLVTQSWLRDPSFKRFMLRRSLRLFPALIFLIASCVFILGPLMSTLTMGDYFSHRETWTYLLKIFIYPSQYYLPGVFQTNTMSPIVNGSLWSLRLEFALYVFIALCGFLKLSRFRFVMSALGIASLTISVLLLAAPVFTDISISRKILILSFNATPFFIGAALAVQKRNPQRPPIPHAFNDYSYGIYLWAFPIQQVIVNVWHDIGPLELFCSALPLTAMMGWISWHIIEKRALIMKPRKPA